MGRRRGEGLMMLSRGESLIMRGSRERPPPEEQPEGASRRMSAGERDKP